ncbi:MULTISPECIES: diguanylate cyclase domain-containing protein [unclassified Coleofasciculus]|uniref:GGDEF domain-containing response regulator n=1 Tax=unclassified Coleofasciculus TaxID=2692782 RepID=UPI0018825C65|nr:MULTISPECIES: diguanylate cyclase [unclassified Coleofasciculus]MBE9125078.1 diguanylate cyclase [Coleofasciculus sp. LEGE 07081]MBE9150865.1 diguanylate cyclase [Coleofasciculus sp. LEGE 07092]
MNSLEISQGIIDSAHPLKILLIEDNAAEIELVQEWLTQGSKAPFELTQSHYLSEGLQYLLQSKFDIILLDLFLPDSQGLETVVRVKSQAPTVPIVVLTVLNDRTIAIEAIREGAQDYLIKGQFTGELLVRAIRYAIERQRDREAIRQQVEREQLLERTIENIRQFLDLADILQTTTAQVRQFLKTDRVLIYRCHFHQSRCFILEAANCDDFWVRKGEINAPLMIPWNPGYQSIQAVDDINTAQVDPQWINTLKTCQAKAVLSIPIWQREPVNPKPNSKPKNRLWGIVMAHHCSHPRQWQLWEIDCLKQLTNQVAVAIQQSELYQQLEVANQQLQQLATLDSLTRIANRRKFDRVLMHEWRRLAREFKPLSLILCDIDFFKRYNDTYGHLAGDACLQQVAKAIAQAAKRTADLVARYGGEEFVVILPGTDPDGAFVVAEKIRDQLKEFKLPHSNSPIKPWVTLSIGIATVTPSVRQSPTKLVNAADQALYQAKGLGRDRIFQATCIPHSYTKSAT